MATNNGRWRYMACADDSNRFAMTSWIPLKAPSSRRLVCAELLARINAELGFGHFDLNFQNGEIEFRTVVPTAHRGRVAGKIVAHVFEGHAVIVDRFLPVLAAVLFARIEPRRALAVTDNSGWVLSSENCGQN